jgi:transcriptional regulator with XRE-family HTH domain
LAMGTTKLHAVREAAGLSARELARGAKVTTRSIERAESRGDRVRKATYQRHVDAARRVLQERLDALNRLAGAVDQ